MICDNCKYKDICKFVETVNDLPGIPKNTPFEITCAKKVDVPMIEDAKQVDIQRL